MEPGGAGRGWGGGGGVKKFPGNSFPFPHSPPLSLGADLSEPWERENEMLFGFPCGPSPAPATWVWSARGSAVTRARPSWGLMRAGTASNPPRLRGLPSAAARSRSPRRRPGSGPVRLKLISHEPQESGSPGCGRGRARREGAAQSTYMLGGPADGCQEFPMRGDGGKFGQLGLANREPGEGSAPSPRPRPPPSGSASVWAPLSVRAD